MNDVFIGGVANITMFKGDQVFATGKSLMTSSIKLGVTAAEVRGGQGAALRGKYFHTSKFDLTIEDCLFKLEYIAANIGSDIVIGGDVLTKEQVTLGLALAGTTGNTAVDFGGEGTIGWVSLPGTDNWQKITINGTNFTSPIGTVGQPICVMYKSNNASARELSVSSNIIPDTLRIIMEAQLFEGGSQDISARGATKIGSVFIEIPRFILDGAMQIDMTSTGVAKTPLNGSAMTMDSTTCDGDGTYGTITEVRVGSNWYDDVNSLAIADSEIALSTTHTTETLSIYAVHATSAPSIPSYADLTFTSSAPATCTVSANGTITRVAAGTAQISVAITAKPDVIAVAEVTVS